MMKDNKILYLDGEPCNHFGCKHHLLHPCENCGGINARGVVYKTKFLRKKKGNKNEDRNSR